jgi:hypothetical protein
MTLTTRGWVVLYCVAALLGIIFLIWADATWFDPTIDKQLADTEGLR